MSARRLSEPGTLVLLAIGLGTLLRLGAAAAMGSGIDESYQIANARSWQLSYFDHPPLSFWISSITMRALHTDTVFVMRLPFILIFVATSLLLDRFTRGLFGGQTGAWAGAWAVVLLNLSPLFAIVAGSWVMPDGPLMCAVLASACCLLPVLAPPEPTSQAIDRGTAWRAWGGAGVFLGVAMLSKYLGVLYAAGVALYVATTPGQRRWLVHPAPYVAVAIALAIFSPVLVWNGAHDWVSFAFQGGRAGPEGGLRPDRVLVSLGGQTLYLLPWIWWPLLVEGVKAVRARLVGASRLASRLWLPACLGLLPVVLMTIVPLWGARGLPHWTAVGYLFLFPLLGLAVATQIDGEQGGLIRGWLRFSIVSFPVLVILLAGHAATGWGRTLMPASMAAEDPTHDTLSWAPVASLLPAPGADEDVIVATLHWMDAAKAGQALGDRWTVTVFSGKPHNFAFLHASERFIGCDVAFVGPPDRLEGIERRFEDRFEGFERLGRVALERRAGPEMEIEVVRGRRLSRPFEWPYPRRRGTFGPHEPEAPPP